MKIHSVLYHDVVAAGDFAASGFSSPGADAYKLERSDFLAHLDRISARVKRPPLTTDELLRGPEPVGSNWMLHFDDGGLSAANLIAPALNARGWHGHFYIPTDFIGKPGFVNREHILQLREQGHVIGSHSCSHPARISALGREALHDEWRRSRDLLSDLLGEAIVVASVPGGFYSRRVAAAAFAEGFQVLFNSEPLSGVQNICGGQVLGRYSIMAATRAVIAARLVAGDAGPRIRQMVLWNVKKSLKFLVGPVYAAARNRWMKPRNKRSPPPAEW